MGPRARQLVDLGNRAGPHLHQADSARTSTPRSPSTPTVDSYLLELASYDDTYMAGVAWRYPQDELAQLEATTEQQQAVAANTTATGISIDKLNFHYGVAVISGRPEWVPEQVFDDGHKTFVRFPLAMLDREAPALFVVSSAGDTQMVNYRVKNDTYVVDRLFEIAELRLGQQSQEIVRIVRTR